MIAYRIPEGVKQSGGHARPALHTLEGGQILVDQPMLYLWRQADGRQLEEIISLAQSEWQLPIDVYAWLACLAEACLLERRGAEIGLDQQDVEFLALGEGGREQRRRRRCAFAVL